MILVASSMEEVKKQLPDIVNGIATIKSHYLRIIHRKGWCPNCEPNQDGKAVVGCPHLKLIPTINEAFNLDIKDYFKVKTI
jgi:hypothetical protein